MRRRRPIDRRTTESGRGQTCALAGRIPFEILLTIFAHLQPSAPDIDHNASAARAFVSSVASTPMVCRHWRAAGTEALYRFVDLTFASERACARFLKTITRLPHLPGLVHGVAFPRLQMSSSEATLSVRSSRFALFGGRATNNSLDAAKLHTEIFLRCYPLQEVHFPTETVAPEIIQRGLLAAVRVAHVGFCSPASTGSVPVLPHLSHAHTLAVTHTAARHPSMHFLNGTESLIPTPALHLVTLHLANLVMPLPQWNALLASLRLTGTLRQLVVRTFMLALSQGDGRDLLLPDDVLPVAGTLERLEVGTVLREPGALHMMPHLRTLSTHVAFPTVLPAPRALPRALRVFRIVDDRRGGVGSGDSWAWPVARFVKALLSDRPPELESVEVEAGISKWDELKDWTVLAWCLRQACAHVGVQLKIDIRGKSSSLRKFELTFLASSPSPIGCLR